MQLHIHATGHEIETKLSFASLGVGGWVGGVGGGGGWGVGVGGLGWGWGGWGGGGWRGWGDGGIGSLLVAGFVFYELL